MQENMKHKTPNSGPGHAKLTGHYTINPRVYIKINLTITE